MAYQLLWSPLPEKNQRLLLGNTLIFKKEPRPAGVFFMDMITIGSPGNQLDSPLKTNFAICMGRQILPNLIPKDTEDSPKLTQLVAC